MSPFRPRRPLALLLWALALALVLKGALPMLAAAAARVQGATVAEVCPVYGVRTVALAHGRSGGQRMQRATGHALPDAAHVAGLDGAPVSDSVRPIGASLGAPAGHGPPEQRSDAAGAHAAGHCSLGASPVLAGDVPGGAAVVVQDAVGTCAAATTAASPHGDAVARWAARLRHGPPARA